jgi:hypothetical protein
MAEYLGPATTNKAWVTSTATGGHRVSDRFATGDDEGKFGHSHEHLIDGDLSRYTEDTPESEVC